MQSWLGFRSASPLPQKMTSCLSRWLKKSAFWWLIWRLTILISATSDTVLWCHHWPSVHKKTGFETLAYWQKIRGSPSPLQSVHKRRTKKWPLHRIPCIVLASFWFSLSLDTLENFWKLHLIYSKRSQQQRFLLHCYIHSWSGFTVSISVGIFFFFLTSTVQQWMKNTDVQGCRWNKTNCFFVCIRLYRNRVLIFSELKHQFC